MDVLALAAERSSVLKKRKPASLNFASAESPKRRRISARIAQRTKSRLTRNVEDSPTSVQAVSRANKKKRSSHSPRRKSRDVIQAGGILADLLSDTGGKHGYRRSHSAPLPPVGARISSSTGATIAHAAPSSDSAVPMQMYRRSTSMGAAVQLQSQLSHALTHAISCPGGNCGFGRNCNAMKRLLQHGIECQKRASGGCWPCRRIWNLAQTHARTCYAQMCPLPWCRSLKIHRARVQKYRMLECMRAQQQAQMQAMWHAQEVRKEQMAQFQTMQANQKCEGQDKAQPQPQAVATCG